MEILRKNITRLLIILLLIPASWALFVPGFYGASDDIHVAWLYELHKALLSNQIPPRFVPDLSFGFGYPLFEFVFPLPFYIAEIFHLLGLSLVDSIKALFFISIPLSFLSMYLLLKQFTSRYLSFAGALLYIYTPYRAVDLYIRGAIGEILSFVFFPLIILSIVKLKERKNLRWIGIGGLTLASLVLSHNISAYMFLPFVALFFVMQFFIISNKKFFLARSALMILLSLLTSIYFWMPAIVESSLMKYDTVFNFADHFPTLLQLITPYWGYGASIPGLGDGMSFFLGTANLFLLIVGIICLIFYFKKFSSDKKMLLIWILLSFLISIFMMNYRSLFLWNRIPLLPYFQFPWRFLIMTTFLIPLLVVALEKVGNSKLLIFPFILVIVVISGSYFRPEDFLKRQDNYYLNRYIPTPVAAKEYLETQEEYLRLPKNTQKRPDRNYPLVVAEKEAMVKVHRNNDLDSTIDVSSVDGTKINYNKYFFPGWIVKIDGESSQILAGSPFGQITFFVPSGSHKANVSFEETNFRKVLDAISLVTFLVSLGLVNSLWQRVRKFGHFY